MCAQSIRKGQQKSNMLKGGTDFSVFGKRITSKHSQNTPNDT